ncbi:unnamed protein product [Symbiodinium sp. CCMP2592]|nr:unnamed protein product [Symbiodinium sp. CCMP2592]
MAWIAAWRLPRSLCRKVLAGGLSSSAVRGTSSSCPQLRLDATRCWLDKIVVGEKLCPFASSVQGSKLRLVASRAEDAEAVIEEVSAEAALLVGHTAKITGPRPETTLLVLDPSLGCAAQWQDLVRLSWRLQAEAVSEQGFQDLLQIVLFHPSAMHSIYAEGFPDPADFTIRAPFPTIHLLRASDAESCAPALCSELNAPTHVRLREKQRRPRAERSGGDAVPQCSMLRCFSEVQTYPDTAEIPVRNKAKLRDQGLEMCQERLNSCLGHAAKGGTRALSAFESQSLFEVV